MISRTIVHVSAREYARETSELARLWTERAKFDPTVTYFVACFLERYPYTTLQTER